MLRDQIPAAFLSEYVVESNIFLYPAVLKAFVTGREPLSAKGGLEIAVYKGRGPRCQFGSYRAILLSDLVGKVLHKVVRNRIYEAVSNFARPFQLGGFKGMSPVFGSLGLRPFSANSRGSSSILLRAFC